MSHFPFSYVILQIIGRQRGIQNDDRYNKNKVNTHARPQFRARCTELGSKEHDQVRY